MPSLPLYCSSIRMQLQHENTQAIVNEEKKGQISKLIPLNTSSNDKRIQTNYKIIFSIIDVQVWNVITAQSYHFTVISMT